MTAVAEIVPIDHAAMHNVAARSRALIEEQDRNEFLVESSAKLRLAIDAMALSRLGDIAQQVLVFDASVKDLWLRLQGVLQTGSQPSADSTKVLSAVNQLQSAINVLSEDVARRKRLDTVNPEISALVRDVLAAIETLFSNVETIRWSVLEWQADEDIAAGRLQKFDDLDAALVFLRRGTK